MKSLFKNRLSVLFLAILLLALAGCASVARREYAPPKEWQTSSPEAQGLDPSVLARVDQYIAVNLPDTTSILVARNGYIVFERYLQGDQETKRPLRAVTKSFTSALVGIAVDKRFIRDIDETIYDYLPDSIREAMNDVTRRITIRHLLTGTSGFPGGGTGWASGEPRALRAILSVPPPHLPGEVFGDNDANANLLSVIITQTSGMRESAFADKYLLGPLGIRGARWSEALEYTDGACDLLLTTREMARFGQLFLGLGTWDGQKLIPEEWVRESTRKQVDAEEFLLAGSALGYGYHWWTTELDGSGMYFAFGSSGQYICVIADANVVVAMTGSTAKGEDRLPLVRELIIKSVAR